MRHALRFKPEPLDTALIQFDQNEPFNPSDVALIVNESYTGSALILSTEKSIVTETIILVKIAKLPHLKAKIVWVKEIEKGIIKIGVEYQE